MLMIVVLLRDEGTNRRDEKKTKKTYTTVEQNERNSIKKAKLLYEHE